MKKWISIVAACFTSFYANSQDVVTEEHPEGLKVGAQAPNFEVIDQSGDTLVLSELLKNGKVVLSFYRGAWCPYCNRQMAALQDSLQLILDKGATLIAISPEVPESNSKLIKKTGATFSVVYDKDYVVMKKYQTAFVVDKATVERYDRKGLDLKGANGNTDYILPVPATYIIGEDGVIDYVYFDTNYRTRTTVKEILRQLDKD